MEKPKKYKIDEALKKMNIVKYKAAMRILPKQLNISANTFHNYRKLSLDIKADIPCEVVRKLEILLSMEPGELANYKVETETLESLIQAGEKGSR